MGLGLRHRPFGVALAAVLLLVGGLADAASADPAAPAPALVRLPLAKVMRGAVVTSSSTGGSARLTRQPAAQATRPPASDWQVTYRGFTPSAQAAFKAAVDTWAGLISSRQPITVCATFKDLGGEGVLGQAGPTDFVQLRRDGNGGDAPTYYPLALANALTHSDLSPVTDASDPCSGSDITAEFSSTEPCIYYGTDGAPPRTCTDKGRSGGYIDFETIVLHELAHGLGFLGSAAVVGGLGYFGDGGTKPDPTVYDRFVVQSAGSLQGKHLVTYPSGSSALAGALTSGALYWDGPSGKAADRGRPVRLYAPATFADASSFSHLSDSDFPAGDPDALMTPFIADGEVIHDPGTVALGMFADMGWGIALRPAGVRYTPVNPVRILDTRDGTGGLVGRLGSGKAFDLLVVGGSSGVPTDATAVVLNVTGIGPPSPTNLRLYPTPRSGTAQPLVSNLNLATGATRANLVTVPVGQGGRVRILNSGGAPHVLVDVEGWYGASGGSALEPTTPVRLLDTRDGTGGVAGALGPGQTIDLTVTGGARSVPDTATAVILTVTAVNATEVTDVRVYPTPTDAATPAPQISNINLGAGQIVPNLVIAKVGSGGRVRLRNSAGSVDLVADLAGWYDGDANGALFHVLAPQRVLDTRTSVSPRLRTAEERDLPLAGVAGVPITGAAAVAVNVTGVDASQTTDIAVYPKPNDGSFPLASNLNLQPHQTAADLAIVATGLDYSIRLRNSTGEVALVVDLVGWFGF